jgi:cell division protein FtsQ
MARSLAGGSAIGRSGRRAPPGAPRLRIGRQGPAREARWAPSAKLASLRRATVELVLGHRRLALALLAGLALVGAGWLWLRHSSLVAVEQVRIGGVAAQSPDARAIEAALGHAARGMSTLDVNTAALRDAVARFEIVRSVQAHAIFPHGLRIEVVEQPPVAALEAGGSRTAVAADGIALGPGLLNGSLPTVHPDSGAAAILPLAGRSVRGAMVRQELIVLGIAPRALAALITRVYAGPLGVTVVLADRVRAYFGDATRPHAKWLSLARVLDDPSSSGASYVDVRVPERPAAGFAPGTAHASTGSEAEPSSASDPTTAGELAAGLEAAVAGGLSGTGASTSAGGEAPSTTSPPAQAGAPAPGAESSPGAPAEGSPGAAETSTEHGRPGG